MNRASGQAYRSHPSRTGQEPIDRRSLYDDGPDLARTVPGVEERRPNLRKMKTAVTTTPPLVQTPRRRKTRFGLTGPTPIVNDVAPTVTEVEEGTRVSRKVLMS